VKSWKYNFDYQIHNIRLKEKQMEKTKSFTKQKLNNSKLNDKPPLIVVKLITEICNHEEFKLKIRSFHHEVLEIFNPRKKYIFTPDQKEQEIKIPHRFKKILVPANQIQIIASSDQLIQAKPWIIENYEKLTKTFPIAETSQQHSTNIGQEFDFQIYSFSLKLNYPDSIEVEMSSALKDLIQHNGEVSFQFWMKLETGRGILEQFNTKVLNFTARDLKRSIVIPKDFRRHLKKGRKIELTVCKFNYLINRPK
jgi:hypothetical protein